jgi:hypothetical protein
LQDLDQKEEAADDAEYSEKLDRIEEGIRALSEDEIPRLKTEIRELRNALVEHGYGRGDETTS